LVKDPRQALERLYRHFGWEMSEEFSRALARATERQRGFQSKHEYSLEEYGLSREWIQQELGSLLEFYSLPP
jgi:hypothetical protein